MVKQYAHSARTMWIADSLQCGDYSSGSVPTGAYYIEVDSMGDGASIFLEQGGKTPWGIEI